MNNTIDIPELRAGRRRRFSQQEKVQILTEAAIRNESLSAVGRRYGIAVTLLFRWKRQLRVDIPTPEAVGSSEPTTPSIEDVVRAMRALEAEVNWLSRQNRKLQERVLQFETATAFQHNNLSEQRGLQSSP